MGRRIVFSGGYNLLGCYNCDTVQKKSCICFIRSRARWEWAGLKSKAYYRREPGQKARHLSYHISLSVSSTANGRWVYINTYTTGHGSRLLSTPHMHAAHKRSERRRKLTRRAFRVPEFLYTFGGWAIYHITYRCHIFHS